MEKKNNMNSIRFIDSFPDENNIGSIFIKLGKRKELYTKQGCN